MNVKALVFQIVMIQAVIVPDRCVGCCCLPCTGKSHTVDACM
jgi:hypothetical protein